MHRLGHDADQTEIIYAELTRNKVANGLQLTLMNFK